MGESDVMTQTSSFTMLLEAPVAFGIKCQLAAIATMAAMKLKLRKLFGL